MRSDFETILLAEGVKAESVERIDAWLREKSLTIAYDHRAAAAAYAAEKKAEKAARLAAAIPYAGAIKTCQAMVPLGGRQVGHRRCASGAKFVTRITEDREGDGRLAVCRPHTDRPTRFIKHWNYEVSATEQVEPEYQP